LIEKFYTTKIFYIPIKTNKKSTFAISAVFIDYHASQEHSKKTSPEK